MNKNELSKILWKLTKAYDVEQNKDIKKEMGMTIDQVEKLYYKVKEEGEMLI